MGNTRRFLPDNARGKTDSGISPLSSEHRKRAELFGRYWNYYNGHHKRNLKGNPADNVTLNFSRKVVNEGLRFLFPAVPQFYEDDDEKKVTSAEAWMAEYWQADPSRGWSPFEFLQALGQNGFVCGTPFVKLLPQVNGTIELRAIDPAMVNIETDPDDIQTPTAYDIIWKRGDVYHRQRMEKQDGGMAWLVTEADHVRGSWVVTDEELWPYSFAPLLHAHNLIVANSIWGASDLEEADLNDNINFTASNNSRILRFHAHPKTIGTGFSAKQLEQTAVDELWTITDPNAKVFNLEMQSDLAASRAHMDGLIEAFHQISAVPRLDPATVNVGALSGFALRILYGPLLSKTRQKQATYGMLLAQTNRALLELAGMKDVAVKVKWEDPLPGSEQETDERIERLVRSGAALEGAAKIAGYAPEEIKDLVNGATVEVFDGR